MRVNGAEVAKGGSCTLMEFLVRENYPVGRIAVEKNGTIVPRAQYEAELLSDSDKLEIVSFVGGG